MNKATAFSTPTLGANYIYTWNFGTGATLATATGIGTHNVSYSTTGSKTVSLTVTGAVGTTCTAVNATKTITIANCTNPSTALTCEGNLVPNPSFENNFVNWSVWNPASIIIVGDKNSGEKAARIGNNQGGFALQSPITITGGDNLKINLYAKIEGNPYAAYGYNFLDASGNKLEENSTAITSNTYQLYTKLLKVPANATKMTFWLWKSGDTGYLYIDDVCIAKAAITNPTPTPCPNPTLAKTPLAICTNTDAAVEATDLGVGYTYTWAFGVGATPATATGRVPTAVKFANTGTQLIRLTASHTACGSKTVSQNITVTNCTTPNPSIETIAIINFPANIQRGGKYTIKVSYTVLQKRDIKVQLTNNSTNFGNSTRATVQAGTGTIEFPFTVSTTVPNGSAYIFVAHIIEAAATPEVIIKSSNTSNITVSNGISTGRCITDDGNLLRETWYDMPGKTIKTLTDSPLYPSNANSADYLAAYQSSKLDTGDDYAERVRGYIIPTTSGKYTFYITGDDEVELYLSTTDSTAEKALIASVKGWTFEEEIDKYKSQQSQTITLEAGKRYYTELLHKEGDFLDHFAVYWTGPGITEPTIIGSANIAPWDNCASPRQAITDTEPFTVYPNPTSDYIFVDIKRFQEKTVDVVLQNQLGQVIKTQHIEKVSNEPFFMDIQELPTGMYFLQLRVYGRNPVTRRFMVVGAE
jgi:hypothetical protein